VFLKDNAIVPLCRFSLDLSSHLQETKMVHCGFLKGVVNNGIFFFIKTVEEVTIKSAGVQYHI
jgi:hypothetical protein